MRENYSVSQRVFPFVLKGSSSVGMIEIPCAKSGTISAASPHDALAGLVKAFDIDPRVKSIIVKDEKGGIVAFYTASKDQDRLLPIA